MVKKMHWFFNFFVTEGVYRVPFIAWLRFCELARLRIAYCLSVCLCFACLTCNITRNVTIELAHCLGIVNWYWLLIQPFARQAVRWGPFIYETNVILHIYNLTHCISGVYFIINNDKGVLKISIYQTLLNNKHIPEKKHIFLPLFRK